jgi:hypothetical protein
VQPVPGGNIPPEHAALEMKMTFKDGGAFDFHSTYERIKERLQQAVDVARESGQLIGDGTDIGGGNGGGPLSSINLDSVHLDELPAYEDATSPVMHGAERSLVPEEEVHAPLVDLEEEEAVPQPLSSPRSEGLSPRQEVFTPPTEPPPGYETVQNQSVADELERRLRGSVS